MRNFSKMLIVAQHNRSKSQCVFALSLIYLYSKTLVVGSLRLLQVVIVVVKRLAFCSPHNSQSSPERGLSRGHGRGRIRMSNVSWLC